MVFGSAAAILDALARFGLIADEPVLRQSRRRVAYDTAFEQLRMNGPAFPCLCSRSALAETGALHRDGRCVMPPDPQRSPAWRVRVPDVEISVDDALQGPRLQNQREITGDFVIRRADGHYAYQLACVVDDAHQRVSEGVRGLDLLDSTFRQLLLYQQLDLPAPAYCHLPLALDARGHRLSKATQAPAVDPESPLPALRAALAFLQLATMDHDQQEALNRALRYFRPDALPHCSGIPAT